MFEVGFGELLLICALALVVLGPERLPKVAQQVGRWVGRARSMARQFREQLEEEVSLEEKSKPYTPPPSATPTPDASPTPESAPFAGAESIHPNAAAYTPAQTPDTPAPQPTDDHFSHTHGDGDLPPVVEPAPAPPLPPGEPIPETAAARSEHERGT
jgi:sec-independent protein translocase protein TatB